MGWSYGWSSRKEIIADRIESWEAKNRRRDCIKHCYRGNAFSGILWSVWAVTNTETGRVEESYIACDLLRCYKNAGGPDWGYKDMCESMHPYYYSCPLGYLEMVPVANEEWRKGVREYHAKRNRTLTIGGIYKVRDGITLKGDKIVNMTITSLRPKRAEALLESGFVTTVKFKTAHVGEAIAEEVRSAN